MDRVVTKVIVCVAAAILLVLLLVWIATGQRTVKVSLSMGTVPKPPIRAGVPVDEGYLGTWYEQLRLPSWFEPNTLSNVTARYEATSGDGVVRVTNQGVDDRTGNTQTVVGTAKPVSSGDPGHWSVQFDARQPPGSYVVLSNDCGPQRANSRNQCAVVGTADRQGLWLLTRDRQDYNPALYKHVQDTARRYDYPDEAVQRLVRVVQ